MSVALGYTAFVGIGVESTWGTGVAASMFLEASEESLKLDQKRNWKPTLGSTSQSKSTRSKRKVSGSVKFPGIYAGMDTLLKNVMGSVSSAQISATTVYRHTFTLSSALPVGLSFVVNRDAAAISGTSCFRYTGCQVTKLGFSQSVENFLEVTAELEGQDEEFIALPTPTYPAFKGIDWEQLGTFTIGGTAIPAQMVELNIENPLNTDRHKLGTRLRTGLGRSSLRKISGKLELEFADLTIYNFFRSLNTAGALSIIFTGPVAANATNYTFEIAATNVFIQGETPNVKDPGVIKQTVPFELTADGGADNSELILYLQNLSTSVV
jgi:hypothetical protein